MNLDMISDGESWAVKQKLNPLTWNFDMVGEWEVKMKLNPLTSNFDMVSEWGGWGGWLPDDYQEVEYIESNVENWYGQVINTWIYSWETISAEIKLRYDSNYFWDDRWIFGTYWTADALLLTHYFQNIRWHNYGNWADYGDDWNIRIIKVTPEEIIIDWNIYQQESYWQSAEEEAHTICLFTTHRWSNEWWWYVLERCWAYKLYYFKIWNGETLVRDMIPCYRKADNVAWLYDLVEWVFYTNQGTGEFIIPSPTPSTTVQIDLISTNSSQWTIIDENWNLNPHWEIAVDGWSSITYDGYDGITLYEWWVQKTYLSERMAWYSFLMIDPQPSTASENTSIFYYWQYAYETLYFNQNGVEYSSLKKLDTRQWQIDVYDHITIYEWYAENWQFILYWASTDPVSIDVSIFNRWQTLTVNPIYDPDKWAFVFDTGTVWIDDTITIQILPWYSDVEFNVLLETPDHDIYDNDTWTIHALT